MENKQTAVEWLIDQLERHKNGDNQWFSEVATKNHALRLEKEHIENSFADGFVEGYATAKSGKQEIYPEQYYNDIYGKE